MGRPIALSPSLPETTDPAVARWARNVAAIIDLPLYRLIVTVDAEGSSGPDVRRITGQVKNRRNEILKDRFLVHLWLALTSGGDPQDAQTVAFVNGTVLDTTLADGEWWVATDGNGLVVMDVTILGGAVRYLESFTVARIESSAEIAWSGTIIGAPAGWLFNDPANSGHALGMSFD